MKERVETRFIVTWLSGRKQTYAKKNLEMAIKDALWYETDRLERTVEIQQRTVTETPWKKVEYAR